MERDSDLPTYRRPPLVEVIVSILFSPARELTNAHLGAFWGENSAAWPTVRHGPPVSAQLERFKESRWLPLTFNFELSSDPACRIQMFDAADSRLIQVQRDRLVYNWKTGADRTGEYPRFERLRGEFGSVWNDWKQFCLRSANVTLEPIQWEVTYINKVRWNDFAATDSTDWSNVIPLWGWPMKGHQRSDFQLKPIGRSAHWVYDINDAAGRLHVQIDPARPLDDDANNDFSIQFTARGPTTEDLLAGIDLGHKTIVTTFDSMISDVARKVWGKQ